MAKSNIIKSFINSNMTIDIALQNLIAILYCLDDKSLVNWANKELSGYDKCDELPKYRRLKGTVMASFTIENVVYSKRQFAIAHVDEDIQDKLLSVNIYSSIPTLQRHINREEISIGKLIPPEFYKILDENTNACINNASVDVDLGCISDITSKVRGKILETLLFLEKEFGNLDDLDIDISIKSKEELKHIVQHIQVNLYDSSIKIGNNNKIKKSNITSNK